MSDEHTERLAALIEAVRVTARAVLDSDEKVEECNLLAIKAQQASNDAFMAAQAAERALINFVNGRADV